MIKHKKDLWQLLVILLTAINLFFIYHLEFSISIFFVLVVLRIILLFSLTSIHHNIIHHPIFKNKFSNQLLEVFVTILSGYTSAGFKLTHSYNHHQFAGGSGDWMGNHHYLKNEKWAFLKYISRSVQTIKREKLNLPKKIEEKFKKEYRVQFGSLVLFFIMMTLLFPKKHLLIVFPTAFVLELVLIWVNLYQHFENEPSTAYGESINWIAPWYNFLGFNSGFHTVHHLNPTLHWTLLAKEHEKFSDKIPKRCLELSPWHYQHKIHKLKSV